MHLRRNFENLWVLPGFSTLLFLAFSLGCGSARAQQLPEPADPYSFEFEKSPPDVNIVSRQWQEKARQEKQQQFVVRVGVPDAVKPIEEPPEPAAWAAESEASVFTHRNRPQDLGLTTLVLLALALLCRKVAPMLAASLNSRHNPWCPSPAMVGAAAANLLAEEQSFSEFVAAFRIGPATRPGSAISSQSANSGEDHPLRRFFKRGPNQLATLRHLLQQIKPGPDDPTRKPHLEKLRREVRSLKGLAGLPEVLPVWQMAYAMESLLGQLISKGENVTLSTLRTIAQAIDLLEMLCLPGLRPDLATNPPIRLLAVDDDPISRHAVSFALKKALDVPDLAGDAGAALPLCEKSTYDAVFLDVQMPGMDGFELCTKIHETAANRTTPVVFVTCQSDFEARAKSTLAGGHDLMGKPFLTFEITLKALTLVLRGRLQRKPQPVAAQAASERNAVIPAATNETPAAKPAEAQKAAQFEARSAAPQSAEGKPSPAESKPGVIEAKAEETKTVSNKGSNSERPARRKRGKRNQKQPLHAKDRRSRQGKSRRMAAPSNGAIERGVDTNTPAETLATAPNAADGLNRNEVTVDSGDTAQYIRSQLNSLTAAPAPDRPEILAELCLGIHSLIPEADRNEETPAFRLSWALQGMLRKLVEKADRATPSSIQTAGLALSLLDDLRRIKYKPSLTDPPARIMIVDDDPVARRAITGSIQLSFAKPENIESGELALAAATKEPFDLIFLDVCMPGMDGLATCKKMRETSLNGKTPIVFISSHTGPDAQKSFTDSGGNGFIPKPAMAVEVTLTALTHVLRSRLNQPTQDAKNAVGSK